MSEYEKERDVSELRVAALKYDMDEDRAPQVVAAGSGHIAQKILQLAIENGITIYHDDSAATMLAKLESGKEIPPELYSIVVSIYVSLLETADKVHNPGKYTAPAADADADGLPDSDGFEA